MHRDLKTLERIETAHPIVRAELNCIYDEICALVNSQYCQVRFTEVIRSPEKQNSDYAKGRTAPGAIITWVKAWGSYHQYGLAVDIALLLDKDKNGTFEDASWDTLFDGDLDGIADWIEVAKIFKFYGWQWGLYNKKGVHYDKPHFQKTFGFKASELKKLPRDNNGYVIFPK